MLTEGILRADELMSRGGDIVKADAVLPDPAVGMEKEVLDLVEQHPELLGHLLPGTLDLTHVGIEVRNCQ